MDTKTQIILLWFAVAFYAASSVLFAWGWVRSRSGEAGEQLNDNMAETVSIHRAQEFLWAVRLAFLGLLPHTAALLFRWLETGHGPYMHRYEVYSSDVWVVVLVYLLVQLRRPRLRFTGIMVLPSAFLLIGMAVLSSPEIQPLPPTFGTYWLVVHILFAKLAYGCLVIGTALAVFYLIKDRALRKGKSSAFLTKLPELPILNEQSYQFLAFGFIMLAIMIAAGAIWANKAWGRYWGWDPVETWSFISWLLYGIYLHLVRTYGWSGRRPAWLAILAVLILIFALFGIGLVYESLHSPYVR
ncbi:MAG: c-type cytochrome biogenesis protein CcsB [Desulfitobacteriaceae bacterium]